MSTNEISIGEESRNESSDSENEPIAEGDEAVKEESKDEETSNGSKDKNHVDGIAQDNVANDGRRVKGKYLLRNIQPTVDRFKSDGKEQTGSISFFPKKIS